MSDWTHTRPPAFLSVSIFNHCGCVRRGVSDCVYMHLSDCTHPAQNAIYPVELVIAWKVDDAVSVAEVKE